MSNYYYDEDQWYVHKKKHYNEDCDLDHDLVDEEAEALRRDAARARAEEAERLAARAKYKEHQDRELVCKCICKKRKNKY
ncbi:hypothetical protein C7B63_05545 [Bacillus halotolerans]|uniref:hypothetical protein n=1 Tax=Bacillus TaxID=1386 RepID=UPI000D01E64A|nr:hypothetical protein [Bacillus halotolerans]MBL6008220.1 hypothetical protein [Bacillus halotolerans]PRP51807.1 hypothetical protein C7B63_05545 [Bacillus halotolerans]PRP60639.1 hypothetical protein C7B66_01320 [Bacillus halotolerans]PRP65304.1 hypothetical protein C7B72_01315 [Bacillus halotolerans]